MNAQAEEEERKAQASKWHPQKPPPQPGDDSERHAARRERAKEDMRQEYAEHMVCLDTIILTVARSHPCLCPLSTWSR